MEKKLAALKNPKWWGLPSPGGNKDEESLEQLKRDLQKKAEIHGREIQEAQLLLMQCRAAEEEKGQGAANLSRWDMISDVKDAQKVLVQLFMAASRHKMQVYESSSVITEMSEEVEMLRLKLEVAEAERLEQQMQLDELRASLEELEAAEVRRTLTPSSVSRPHIKPTVTEDSAVREVLHELDSIAVGNVNGHDSEDGDSAGTSVSGLSRLSDISIESRAASPSVSRVSTVISEDSSDSSAQMGQMLLPGEIAVLGHMNSIRAGAGLSPVYALSSRDLISRLEQVPDWHDGSKFSGKVDSPSAQGKNTSRKSKAELISDYLALVASQDDLKIKAERVSSPPIVRDIDLTKLPQHDARGLVSKPNEKARGGETKKYASKGDKPRKVWIPAS